MKTRPHDPIGFKRGLTKLLLEKHIQPDALDIDRLTRDMLAGVEDGERKAPRAIVNELGRRFTMTLPAYRKVKPGGPGIPDADNVNPHVPDVADADELTDSRENFHVDAWLDAVAAMSAWTMEHTGQPAHAFRIEQCLCDLLIEFEKVPLGTRTPRALAGRLGIARLVEIITDDYPAGAPWRYLGEDDDEDNEPRLNLAGGPENWRWKA